MLPVTEVDVALVMHQRPTKSFCLAFSGVVGFWLLLCPCRCWTDGLVACTFTPNPFSGEVFWASTGKTYLLYIFFK